MKTFDRYDLIEESVPIEEWDAWVKRASSQELRRIEKLTDFDFIMTVPETIRKRSTLADIFKELYDAPLIDLVVNQHPLLKYAKKTKKRKK
jgi:hypothetical protein